MNRKSRKDRQEGVLLLRSFPLAVTKRTVHSKYGCSGKDEAFDAYMAKRLVHDTQEETDARADCLYP